MSILGASFLPLIPMMIRRAGLTEAEVIAIVLCTGPMGLVYNSILRKWPEELFERFRAADNLFSTSIFVLTSAMLKVSRVMSLPEGLVRYRGLGGTSDLPDAFFQRDQHGCSGFADLGFMTTTSSKQVALNYTGINSDKPLPLLLAMRLGAADRGACVRDFSQYATEMEYLFAPCSFVEPEGAESLEVTGAGVVRVIPVRVRANTTSATVEELERKMKTLHIDGFKYQISNMQYIFEDRLNGHKCGSEIVRDLILRECVELREEQGKIPFQDFLSYETYEGLVTTMLEAVGRAEISCMASVMTLEELMSSD